MMRRLSREAPERSRTCAPHRMSASDTSPEASAAANFSPRTSSNTPADPGGSVSLSRYGSWAASECRKRRNGVRALRAAFQRRSIAAGSPSNPAPARWVPRSALVPATSHAPVVNAAVW